MIGLLTIGLGYPSEVAPPPKVVTLHAATLPIRRPPSSLTLSETSPECSWLAVVIDNSIPARPQSGLSAASVVYELPAEGGITRLLAFFCEGTPEVVGPVRSVRTYMLDIARDYHAVVAHSGESTSALAAITQGTDPVINEFWQPQPFRRERRRRMPHNLYTSVPALRRYIKHPLTPVPPHWTAAEMPPAFELMTIYIPYGPGYDVHFIYDPAAARYRRFIGNRPAVDAATDTPITVASVIVQYARWSQTYEGPILSSRLDLVGSGPMSVFTAGHRIDGRWQRRTPHQPTIFTDQEGQLLSVQPGLVWVNIVPLDHVVRVVRTPVQRRAE